MLDTYIKNRGTTKTIIHDNNKNNISEINWDADYDGNVANLTLDLKNNGKVGHYNIKLNNNDLAKLLNVDSVELPIHQRLKNDFKKNKITMEPRMYDLYSTPLLPIPTSYSEVFSDNKPIVSLDNLLQASSPDSHISSPLPNEELLIPLTIDKNSMQSYVLTPGKKHRRPRTHKTHRVYKHNKNTTSKNRSSKAKKSKSKTHRKSVKKTTVKNSLQKYFNI
jgi:hypothetical protein